jgi:2-polyprenyl-3-methyl-5-hydroxy-6-metoxy-1,4-benzoquinol methylase
MILDLLKKGGYMMMNLKINELMELSKKPALFTPGEKQFWNDPYIAKQMLAAHLDPNTDRASYPPDTINNRVKFGIEYLGLKKGDRILDAGCGPGLYCERFAKAGLQVTGMDISENSLQYAKETAERKGLKVEYINASYLDMCFHNVFDAIFIIWHDFCVLSFEDRGKFLTNVFIALKPGGYFAFDVSTPYSEEITEYSSWYACEHGFWSSEPSLVLEKGYYYPEAAISLYQCVVAINDITKVYRLYHTHYTKETITELLTSHKFKVAEVFEDLTGKMYFDKTKTLGVIAQK